MTSSGTVLIIDDSITVRMDLVGAFASTNFDAFSCSSAVEARQHLAQGSVDVVILDVLLPDADGVELLAELRALPACRDAVVLMLSTEAEVRDRVRAFKTGVDEYIGKPYDAQYVVSKAQELHNRRSVPSERPATVLIIDDSLTLREELQRACSEAGYSVSSAATGAEGLRRAAVDRPDVVVVDGRLPDIDGDAVIRRIRLDAALRTIPCLLLTGSADFRDELLALDAGADSFARKEDDIAVVLARIAALLRQAVPSPEDTPSLSGPKTVLAVDDSPTYLNGISQLLRDDGYDVAIARSGEEALEVVSVQRVDCILLDLIMPGLSGEETCKRLKAVPGLREVPVIAVTSLEESAAMIAAFGAGADDCVHKSDEFEVLSARVRAQIRRKQFENETRNIRDQLLQKEIETTRARAATELAETRAGLVDELRRKNEELEAFSYSVSHDLRAPLRGIDGFSQALVEDYADKLDETGLDYLRRVRSGAQRMGELIDDLLELSRVGRADLHLDRTDLSAIARTIVAALEERDPHRHVTVEIEPRLCTLADPRLIRAALENLFENSWKFTSNVKDAKIEFRSLPQGSTTSYLLRDNGSGFDMQYAEKLFQPFQRLHSDAEFPGTGIGLATVHRIMERHGGSVSADAKIGEGATIYFNLPTVDPEVPEVPVP